MREGKIGSNVHRASRERLPPPPPVGSHMGAYGIAAHLLLSLRMSACVRNHYTIHTLSTYSLHNISYQRVIGIA